MGAASTAAATGAASLRFWSDRLDVADCDLARGIGQAAEPPRYAVRAPRSTDINPPAKGTFDMAA
jgi:hypothetical protein